MGVRKGVLAGHFQPPEQPQLEFLSVSHRSDPPGAVTTQPHLSVHPLTGESLPITQQVQMCPTPPNECPTYIIPEHVGQEGHHHTVLPRVLLAQGTDGLHDHNLQGTHKDVAHEVVFPGKSHVSISSCHLD